MTTPTPDATATIGDLAAHAGLRRIHVVAWRDLDDVEAGGSEVHAAEICRRWADAGLQVSVRTSHAQGHPPTVVRDGYRVTRRAGRYLVFPRAALSEIAHRQGHHDALVEVWNGMPFFSPLWHRGPRITFLHHVHGAMWRMVLPDNLARVGEVVESRIAPVVYRRSQIVTLSESSKADMLTQLRFAPSRVAVVPPGIDARFQPGGVRAPVPTVLAVGRLMPTKRFTEVVAAGAEVRRHVPNLRLVIVGEGYERLLIEEAIAATSAPDDRDWVDLVGRCDDAALVDHYRSAWVLTSASSHEGWGMSITEAAACGTPAVVTDIPGHRDAVVDGVSGILCADPGALAPALTAVLTDPARRAALSAGALAQAARFTWDATATEAMRLLAHQATARARRVSGSTRSA